MGQMACYTGKPVSWGRGGEIEPPVGPVADVASFETPPPTKADKTGNYPLPIPGIFTLG